jgi:hypothetical protein
MTVKTTEIIYFLSTCLLFLIATFLWFPVEDVVSGKLVFNLYDTYFVIQTWDYCILFLPLVVTITYSLRLATLSFRSRTSNRIYLLTSSIISIQISILFVHYNGDKNYLILMVPLLLLLFNVSLLVKRYTKKTRT